MTLNEAFSKLRSKALALSNSLIAGDFTLLLNYALLSCVVLYGYSSFAFLLRIIGPFELNWGLIYLLNSIGQSANDTIEQSLFWIPGTFMLIVLWIFQLNKMLRELGGQFDFSLTAVVWAWIIPVYNFFMPVSIINQTQRKAIEYDILEVNSVGKVDKYWMLILLSHSAAIFVAYFFEDSTQYILLSLISCPLAFGYYRLRLCLGVSKVADGKIKGIWSK